MASAGSGNTGRELCVGVGSNAVVWMLLCSQKRHDETRGLSCAKPGIAVGLSRLNFVHSSNYHPYQGSPLQQSQHLPPHLSSSPIHFPRISQSLRPCPSLYHQTR